MENAAKLLPGGPYRVVVTIGAPPAPVTAAPAGGGDKLDELLALGEQFDNIIIEE